MIDRADGRWGHTHIDNIVFAEKAARARQESALWLDYGTDDYAGVTWSNIPAEDGRRLFIGWMSNWDYGAVTPTERWRSAMTLPRALTLHQSDASFRLHSLPVQELESLRGDKTDIENGTFNGSLNLGKKLQNNAGMLEIKLTLDTLQTPSITLELANKAGEQTLFTIDRQQGVYKLDRTQSGKVDFDKSFASVQTAPIVGASSEVSLRFFIDHSSIEVFINEGETVMTALVFPTEPYNRVVLNADKNIAIQSGAIYELDSILPGK